MIVVVVVVVVVVTVVVVVVAVVVVVVVTVVVVVETVVVVVVIVLVVVVVTVVVVVVAEVVIILAFNALNSPHYRDTKQARQISKVGHEVAKGVLFTCRCSFSIINLCKWYSDNNEKKENIKTTE